MPCRDGRVVQGGQRALDPRSLALPFPSSHNTQYNLPWGHSVFFSHLIIYCMCGGGQRMSYRNELGLSAYHVGP